MVAALVLLRLLGASDLACGAGCVAANSSIFANWMSIVYVVGSCVAVVAEFQKVEALRSALFLCMGAASIGGFMAMGASHHLCALCIAGQVTWFLLGALQLFRLNRWAGA